MLEGDKWERYSSFMFKMSQCIGVDSTSESCMDKAPNSPSVAASTWDVAESLLKSGAIASEMDKVLRRVHPPRKCYVSVMCHVS